MILLLFVLLLLLFFMFVPAAVAAFADSFAAFADPVGAFVLCGCCLVLFVLQKKHIPKGKLCREMN